MSQWEYKVVRLGTKTIQKVGKVATTTTTYSVSEQDLVPLGLEGWELCAFVSGKFVFKRPLRHHR